MEGIEEHRVTMASAAGGHIRLKAHVIDAFPLQEGHLGPPVIQQLVELFLGPCVLGPQGLPWGVAHGDRLLLELFEFAVGPCSPSWAS
jgi:hypothetical protein